MERRKDEDWIKICKKARAMLKSGKAKTVVDVAEQLSVNHRMLSRNAKKHKIILNLKGYGVKKDQSIAFSGSEECCWSIALNLKVA